MEMAETPDSNDDLTESNSLLPGLRAGFDKAKGLAKFTREAAQEVCTDWYTDAWLDDHFKHPKLHSSSCIRLLRILPGDFQSELHCSMRVVKPEDQTSYQALSYTWRKQRFNRETSASLLWSIFKSFKWKQLDGRRDLASSQAESKVRLTKIIFCDGQRVRVSANLNDALLKLRAIGTPDFEYWIDALCINQRDLTEKTSQVLMMGRIYNSASRVIVWLGSCKPEYNQGVIGLDAIAQLPAEKRPACPGLRAYDPYATDEDTTMELASIPLKNIADTAIDISSRHWFRRVWTLQEYLLSQNVIFFYGDSELDLDTMVTLFNWTFDVDDPSISQHGQRVSATRALSLGWAPHVQTIENVLLARPRIALGYRFSLREWIHIGRTRMAEHSRDYIISGLSLIDPNSLQINSNLVQPELDRGDAQSSSSLIPKGLWHVLRADYTVTDSEFLVNLAACLLSTSGSTYFDLLSLAAHPPIGGTDGLPLHLRPNPSLENVPSWVPAMQYFEMFNINLADCKDKTQMGGRPFAAGLTGPSPIPRISRDGKALFLNAHTIDTIGEELLIEIFTEGKVEKLAHFLRRLAKMPLRYEWGLGTGFDAFARTLASSLLSPSGSESNVFQNRKGQTDDCNSLFSTSEARAPFWLQEVIDREVRIWVGTLREDIDAAPSEKRTKLKMQLNTLLSCYRYLCLQFPHIPWSENTHREFQGLDEDLLAPRFVEGTEFYNRLIELGIAKFERFLKRFTGRGFVGGDHSWIKSYPVSANAQQYVEALDTRLPWSTVFQTDNGLLGTGPKWLEEGDKIMLVQGANVPYVFRSAEKHRQSLLASSEDLLSTRQETLQKLKMEGRLKNALSILNTGRSISELKSRIGKLQAPLERPNGWLLIGEAYVEGIMHGEILTRTGNDCFQQIVVV